MQESYQQVETPESDTPALRPAYARYLVTLLALSFVLYLLPFFLVRVPSFETWGGCFYGPALDFGFAASGQNADVVIFGDSSALFGIAPRQISAVLGIRAINLPNTLGSLPVTGDMVLRRYLQHNRAPRLIVFYFAPWNLNYSHQPTPTVIYEGEEMLARHGTLREIAAFSATHPADPILFPFRFYNAVPKSAMLAHLRHQNRAVLIASTMGHVDAAPTVPRLGKDCSLPKDLVRPVGLESMSALVAKYSSPQTRTLVFVAPAPACDNASVFGSRSYDALQAVQPELFAPDSYKDDAFFIHLDPSSVPYATNSIIQAIRRRLDTTSAPAHP